MSYRSLATALCLSACTHTPNEAASQPNNARLVSTPSSIAVLTADHETNGLPGEVCFGGPLGRSALFLKFPDSWRAQGTPLQAFVALSAREGAAVDAEAVTVEAWRVNSAWAADTMRNWSDKPDLSAPHASTRVTPATAQALRIDVTELLQFAATNPERDFGIALIGSGGNGHGATFATGMSGGNAPRLEITLSAPNK